MATSAAPAAIDALLAILTAAKARPDSALADAEVIDGPAITTLPGEAVYVGYQPDGDAAVGIEQQFASAGARRRDEALTISGYIEVNSGDTEMKPIRDRAFAMLAVIETELRATDLTPDAPTLGGAVLWAHLTAGNLRQYQSTEGVTVGLAFTVSGQARL
ncbi:hypothetical protein ACIP9H_40505 [Streptomyces sp. NPDC088732]|uniref:hypothetical protein n=1 Tax=Streptomyces sp. NPDC088732 TaxID=3365879 RepID=UPI0038205BA1